MDDERDRPRSDRREGAYKMDRDYERGRGDYPPPPPRDRGYDRDRMTSSRDYKPDKREHYDERRDHRMDTSPYPPDRRSMKRSREYDQREPKEPYGRDEREMYDRRERDRRRDEERSPTRKRGRYDEGPESLRGSSSGSDDKKRAQPYGSKTPLLFEGLMKSYKQFFEILGEHLPQHEAQKRYEEYKKEFNKRNSRTFFNEHCKEEWFKERYHPEWMKKRRETKIERAKAEAKIFADELERGVLKYNLTADDFPHLLTKSSYEEGAPSHSSHHHDDEEEHSIGDGSLEVRDEGPEVTEEHAAQAGEEHSANNNNNEDSEGGKSKEGGGKQISIKSSRPLDPRIDSSLDSYAAQQSAESNTNKAPGPQETKDKVIHFFPPRDPHTLFIKTIPPSCSREELLAVISKVEGGELRRLIIGQPNPYKYFHRVGWITYTSDEACDYALKTFNNYKFPDFALMLTTHIHRGGEQVRVTPAISSDPERLARDLKQLRQLAVQLDSEKGITENILVKRDDQDLDKDLALHQKVDRYNMYIRRVHAYCYYCSEEFFDPEDLFFRCGELHLRGTEKNHGDQDTTAWYDNVDSKFRQRLETPDDPTTYGGQKMIDRFKDEYATERTVRVEEGKYRCALCDKLFKGPEFVKKHIIAPVKADHVQIPEEVVMKAIDEQYYENYLSDPKRILPSNINFTKENEKQAQRNKKQNQQQQQFDEDRQQQGYRGNRGGGRGRGGFRGGRGRGGFNRGYGAYGNDGPQDKPMYESRKIMSYVDLDAPPDDSIELDYAKALKQFAEKQQQNK